MANYNEAWRLTSAHEGGYVNDPDDPGGETKFGISKRAYPHLDIKNLRVEDAKAIYMNDYWRKCRLGRVESQIIANKVFDIAVNSGVRKAGLILQQACNELGKILQEDGIIGEKTIRAVNSFKYPDAVEKVITYLRVKFYLELAQSPKKRKFLMGWLRRA